MPKSSCDFHIFAPPESEAMHLCAVHYIEWRNGPREGPARIEAAVIIYDDKPKPCKKGCEACKVVG